MAESDRSNVDVADEAATGVLASDEFDWRETPPSLAVIDMLSAAPGVDPLSLSSDRPDQLHEYVDPDALDALVRDGDDTVAVRLLVDGCLVDIHGPEVTVSRS